MQYFTNTDLVSPKYKAHKRAVIIAFNTLFNRGTKGECNVVVTLTIMLQFRYLRERERKDHIQRALKIQNVKSSGSPLRTIYDWQKTGRKKEE